MSRVVFRTLNGVARFTGAFCFGGLNMEPTLNSGQVIQPAFRAGSSFCANEQSQVLFTEGLAFFMREHGSLSAGYRMAEIVTDNFSRIRTTQRWGEHFLLAQIRVTRHEARSLGVFFLPCLWSLRGTGLSEPGDASTN